MPNWCSNGMIVKGNGHMVKKFIKENFRNNEYNCNNNTEYIYVLDFEQFDPTPLDENGDVDKDWYSWRLEHWGCKWSPCDEQQISLSIEYEDGKVETVFNCMHHLHEDNMMFDEKFVDKLDGEYNIKLELSCYYETPWGPPDGIVNQWFGRYGHDGLDVELNFYEPGCMIMGKIGFENGEYVEEYADSHDRKEWIKSTLDYGWEDVEWYIVECEEMLKEMHSEDVFKVLMPKVEETLSKGSNEQVALLVADIMEKYLEWCNKEDEKEGE
jgi:hypothetical protein